ncbi:2Fe-2S iron-sulfur cluster-binding protein [Roseibium sp.]|uniref:2Fe-2S iron-sulfur cluster-binding protein n=1 Tax=Roseibium sp. TaxID=1936156 RepID=UPI003B52F260
MKLFSDRNRAPHLGPFPLERLARISELADLSALRDFEGMSFQKKARPESIINAMSEAQAMLDALRDGVINETQAEVPGDLLERQNHLKAFGYFADASMMATCALRPEMLLDHPLRNPDIGVLADKLKTTQTKSLASGIDMIMADLRDAMEAPAPDISNHSHALIIAVQTPREVRSGEPGETWLKGAGKHRSALRAAEVAVVLAQYLRLLGYSACAHSHSTSDVDLNRLAVASGLAVFQRGAVIAPYIGTEFSLAAVTTDFQIAEDAPLAGLDRQSTLRTHGPAWHFGYRTAKSGRTLDPFQKRRYVDGAYPFEKLKRVDTPTTFIDEARVPRVPKRADMFARALFGDMGKKNQVGATGGQYVRKSAPSMAQRRALGAFVLLQDGEHNSALAGQHTNAQENAENLKAMSYFLGVDAVGLSRCPDWAWYSHDAAGAKIDPPHDQAISMVIDQGFDTMEGATGDDWIAVSQSMRAYLRFSVLGSIVAKQIRNLGYPARAHTVMDGEVLQPPLLLLSGLGEVSRIGEVILNPYLGPRLKSGAVTTTMPLAHDKPISFGLQNFCENCNKCARECPSGAITAGPKLMFNGYEIWKSDSQKCTTYRVTNQGGAMCGRCMKTCPWNLEGIFSEAPFRWVAMNVPQAAPYLAKLDDIAGNGEQNFVKKWWWDLEHAPDGAYRAAKKVNVRQLQKDLDLRYEDQTLAVYPANLAPHPWPFPFPMEREKGIEAYQALITAEQYKARLERNEIQGLAHEYRISGDAPVICVEVTGVEVMTDGVTKYEFSSLDGTPLPRWDAGAHIDIVVAPEFLRQYSLCSDPADLSKYQIGVLKEEAGRGGSRLLHRIFTKGRKIFISRPINHFPLQETAKKSYLMGGGIGITPMIAMANRLHSIGGEFEVHYCCSRRADAGFLNDLATVPWAERVQLHFSDEGTRADLAEILKDYAPGAHVYSCGPARFMSSVMEAAEHAGFQETERHVEYFNVPDTPEYENHAFTLKLARSGREIKVPADRTAAEVLGENGIQIDIKCSDGICGICKCGLVSGDVEHRDFVLSKSQRENTVILCQSRAAKPDDVIVVDL